MAAPDAQAQLTALKAIDSSYRQRQFIEAGGWAAMPDMDEAARQAADLCAKALSDLEPDAAAATPVEGAVQPVSVAQ